MLGRFRGFHVAGFGVIVTSESTCCREGRQVIHLCAETHEIRFAGISLAGNAFRLNRISIFWICCQEMSSESRLEELIAASLSQAFKILIYDPHWKWRELMLHILHLQSNLMKIQSYSNVFHNFEYFFSSLITVNMWTKRCNLLINVNTQFKWLKENKSHLIFIIWLLPNLFGHSLLNSQRNIRYFASIVSVHRYWAVLFSFICTLFHFLKPFIY